MSVEEPKYTEDQMNFFCAWADYRKEYSLSEEDMIEGYPEFKAGWEAARDNWTVNFDKHTAEWKAGFKAYHGTLDIGGVMR